MYAPFLPHISPADFPSPPLAELYNALYNYLLTREDVTELTIEDPAEAFEDLRDKNDLKMLLSNTEFVKEGYGEGPIKGRLGPPAEKAWVEEWRVKLKMAKVSGGLLVFLRVDRYTEDHAFPLLLFPPWNSDNSNA